MNSRGQILLPGLGLFGLFFGAFLLLVRYGNIVLQQMRLDMAAEAVTLSVTRAEAQMLNDCAAHNMGVNSFFLAMRYNNLAAMQTAMQPEFELWQIYHKIHSPRWGGYCGAVASQVAKQYGATAVLRSPTRISSQLTLRGLTVQLMDGAVPAGIKNYDDVYYERQWSPSTKRAQPNHRVTWMISKGTLTSIASAQVYLDVKPDAGLHNGGFPRADEDWEGKIGFQSFYPQFNARLVPAK
jgi:hypothetical protein